ncbi:peptidase domain-containing ABC transporter [Armatimonas rosea]|uniref:ATP-binding cassette subfamily B protein n=1 Tax=Armatimonas rosea TaxID=685828 RepID=A0A7W9W452_ARMRO|nr:ABC transporter ATP-binding protein [Armatimonas rosea]MBB6049084.1 ATP-binding cassette subfamily B protein [Armatimonas rosea]
MASSHHHHPTPTARLLTLLSEDKSDLGVLCVYTVVTGLLGLAMPLAVQSLVNSVAASTVQPLVVLSLLVLLGLLAAGWLSLLQLSLVETLQQRLFARSALKIARNLIHSTSRALYGTYAPELANRFFDILTIQKSLAKILLDGLAAALQAVVGLIILAFYDKSGLLLGFDVLVLLTVGFVIFPLGINGLRTSLAESAEKYHLAGWLEELARCQRSFKLHSNPDFLLSHAENHVSAWLRERRRHFAVTFRQEAGSQLFSALATAGVLAIGGYLVVQRELTLGQLIAAQLIVANIVKATDKLLRQAETLYDLLTGLDKTGYLTDLETEREGGHEIPSSATGGAQVVLRDVHFTYPGGREVLSGLNLSLEPGERISLVGASGAGKSTLAALLGGLEEPSFGLLEINGVELRGASLSRLRELVNVMSDEDAIFEGTIEENIRMGRPGISAEQVRWAIELAQCTTEIAALPEGLQTRLVPGGGNLSRGQAQRLLIARAIVDRPELLIFDEAFTGLDENTTLAILDGLFAPENPWTIIDISHEGPVVTRASTVYVLAEGKIVESGSPQALAATPSSEFARLFPLLSRMLQGASR